MVRKLVIMWLAVLLGISMAQSGRADQPQVRAQAKKLQSEGNFTEALVLFRQLCTDPATDPLKVAEDLMGAFQCISEVDGWLGWDELVEQTIKTQPSNWRLIESAAQRYLESPHFGSIVNGTVHRGPHREGGRPVVLQARDEVRALQLMQQAMPLVDRDDDKSAAAGFYQRLAGMLLQRSSGTEAWRLQMLTDLKQLPEVEEADMGGYGGFRGRMGFHRTGSSGAPVDANDQPVYHRPSASWAAAESDGQRWRWCLNQAVELDGSLHAWRQLNLAEFAISQFGVETIQQMPWWNQLADSVDGASTANGGEGQPKTGTFALQTLAEDETIARLATGVRRFRLPDDYNYIKLLREVAEQDSDLGSQGLMALAQAFTNRRQYDTAAEQWRRYLERNRGNLEFAKAQLDQIEGNWGQLESTGSSFTVGTTSLEYRFRNGRHVTLEARPINIEKLLSDAKAYLRSRPREPDWQKFTLEQLGMRLVMQNQEQYLGEALGQWGHELEPRSGHFDRRVTLKLPINKPGAYLVKAAMRDGNASYVVMWVHDTVIIRKPLSQSQLYLVADAVTGQPLPRVNLEFFGYKMEAKPGGRGPQLETLISNFAARTDQDGAATPSAKDLNPEYQWLIVARGEGGRLAYSGFQGIWHPERVDPQFDQQKILVITDRPVYRPGHQVQWKLWVGQARYDLDDSSPFAGKPVEVMIRDPEGKEISRQTLIADAFGGVAGNLTLPANAKLGVYSVATQLPLEIGGNTFRVEEYKKPEFEVSVEAPKESIQLGEAFTAKVVAKYYFGAPVTEGTVHYKVLRYGHTDQWFPVSPWDWCFGPGYWWYAYDAPWYPGFAKWVGCRRPLWPWIWPGPAQPPELIAEGDSPLTADGTVEVKIDTAIAKELLGDTSHRYEISAEVRDASRRTIAGKGEVIASRDPFRVFTWVDRGYYRVGQTIEAHFQAQTVDRRPVQARGTAKLLRVTYDDQRQPVETPMQTWEITTDESGVARLAIDASAPGQYRLSCELADEQGRRQEGGYLFTVVGEGFTGNEYRFNALELIPDQREYRPGDKVRLQVNTDRTGSFVWLFVRPLNGVYLPPQLLRLDGKSTVVELDVQQADMPNFFVEAVTVADGKMSQEVRELFVPPDRRVVNVDVVTDQVKYLPGGKASVQIRLTDLAGKPVTGSTVVSIYDKSLEYIAGQQLTPDIKDFFWKWRRHHNPERWTSLDRFEPVLGPPGLPVMQPLGIFGNTVADEMAAAGGRMLGRGYGGGGGYGAVRSKSDRFAGGSLMSAASPAAAPMAAMADGNLALATSDSGDTSGVVEPTVRSQFADTALWVAALNTDAQGLARVELAMPENLTTWKIRCWSMGAGTRVGQGDAEVITTKNLIIRLQAPRFLLTGDEVVLSANVHNYLKTDKQVQVKLDVPKDVFDVRSPLTATVKVSADGEQRVNWRAVVLKEGDVKIRMSALTDEESDAMEISLPVKIRGADIQQSWAGTLLDGRPSATLEWNVPEDRRPGSAAFTFRWSPTLAGAMIDALPYMAEYPYGCTEQTLNRFLPTVVTHRTLQRLGVDLEKLASSHTNLNAQQLGDARERAAAWKRFDRGAVYDKAEVDRMVQEGLKHLAEMQMTDGGWGWFGGWRAESAPHTTAVVVRGLLVAKAADVPIVPDMLQRGLDWLANYQQEQVTLLERGADPKRDPKLPFKEQADNLDSLIYHILVDAERDEPRMREFLYRDRIKLSLYGKALLGLAVHRVGDSEKLNMVLRNLDQFVQEDATNETAYINEPGSNAWWYWYGSEPELHATYLKLLTKVDPKGPRAARLVKYLLNNRQHGTYWNSTRDTALVVEAFADYLQASGEMKNQMKVQLLVDGHQVQEIEVTPDNLLELPNTLVIAGEALKTGPHRIEVRRSGGGPIYFNGYMSYSSLEKELPAAGLEVQVERKYYRLTPAKGQDAVAGNRGQVVEQARAKYDREELKEGTPVSSGDLIEVELNVTSKNDYEYLLIKDPKAAGCEAVEVRSGYAGDAVGSYAEYRDDHAAFFVQRLSRGTHRLAYQLRAETPGKFTALPASVSAMYAPELKGNSRSRQLEVTD
ncbi:MAG: MG2 domain-containing protein [Pirellulales bacterium]